MWFASSAIWWCSYSWSYVSHRCWASYCINGQSWMWDWTAGWSRPQRLQLQHVRVLFWPKQWTLKWNSSQSGKWYHSSLQTGRNSGYNDYVTRSRKFCIKWGDHTLLPWWNRRGPPSHTQITMSISFITPGMGVLLWMGVGDTGIMSTFQTGRRKTRRYTPQEHMSPLETSVPISTLF